LIFEGVEIFESVFRRFGEGSSGEAEVVGEEAAALCMNFIVKSREDMDFGGVGPWLLVADILRIVKVKTDGRDLALGPVPPLLVSNLSKSTGCSLVGCSS
jgi:hypothetical protein